MLFTFSPGFFGVIQFNNSQTGPGLSTLVTGLCAFYNFDGNINDSTNNSLNLGTGGNSAYDFTTGKTGASAIQFINYGRCGAAAGLTYPNNIWDIYDSVTNASFSFWVKIPQYFPSANPTNNFCSMTIFGANFGDFGFAVGPAGPTGNFAPNLLVFYLAGNATPSITATFITNTWYHFAGVLNNTNKTYTVYRNGAVLSAVSFTSITAPSQNYQGFAIDGSGDGTSGEYGVPCTFDTVGLWKRALSASEITALYNGGSGIQYPFITYNANYLLVAGGGSGGIYSGGGAGGVISASNITFASGTVYNITVGAGGPSTYTGSSALNINGNGSNSSIISNTLTAVAIGGGAGATIYTGNGGGIRTSGQWIIYGGANGGSGGGSGGNSNGAGVISLTGGSGVSGQGNKGGDGASVSCTPSGPGGGAGAAGVNAFNGYASNPGGIGIINPIAGSTIGQLSAGNYWIAGGGAGATNACTSTTTPASGGLGGGGRCQGTGGNASLSAASGIPNTGGGGGGSFSTKSGDGGSGVVILSVPTINYTGNVTGSPVITTNGSNTLITFLSSGSYTA